MAEAMSYMAGSELPLVLVNVMRGGPGLGSIGPSQSDYFQATKGHGHGDYRVPVLAPSSIAEAVDLVATAFEIAERYRTPTMLLADGVMGQAMEPVVPTYRIPDRSPDGWQLGGAVDRAAARRPIAPSPAGGARSPQSSPAGQVPDDRGARGPLGRASVSTMPRSRSSPTARRPASRGRRSSGLAITVSRSDCSGRSACGPSRPRPWRRSPPGSGRSSSSSCRPDRWSRTSAWRSPAPRRSASTGAAVASSRPRARSSTRCAVRGPPLNHVPEAEPTMTTSGAPDGPGSTATDRRRRVYRAAGAAGGSLDPLLPGLRPRDHPPRRRRAARRAGPRTADDRRGVGRLQRLRLRLPRRRLRRIAARPGTGRRDRRPPRPSRTPSSSRTRATATSPRSAPRRSSTRPRAGSGSASSSSTTASTG